MAIYYSLRTHNNPELAEKAIRAVVDIHGNGTNHSLEYWINKTSGVDGNNGGWLQIDIKNPSRIFFDTYNYDVTGRPAYQVLSPAEFFEKFPSKEKAIAMKKSDLKNGDLVVYINGSIRMVQDGKLIGIDGYSTLEGFNDDLTSGQRQFSIYRVYRNDRAILGSFCLAESEKDTKFGNYKLLWEGEKPISVGEYEVQFNADGIKVGCTSIDKETIKAIYNKVFQNASS